MKTFALVHIGRDTFIMLNPTEELKNNQCNSSTFENKNDANLDVNVFDYYGVKVNILESKLDRRTKQFKRLESQYPYFSVAFLPEIKKRSLESNYTRKASYSK